MSYLILSRYQHSSKPVSLSKESSPHSSDQPHSVSMDVPGGQGRQPLSTRPRVSQPRSVGEPVKVHHLTPPVDRHKVGHKKAPRTGGRYIIRVVSHEHLKHNIL